MGWFMLMFLVFFVLWFLWGYINLSESGAVWFNRLLGRPRIYIRDGREFWAANLLTNPFGETYAWRYPASKTGYVRLNADGTGDYCGHVVWRLV